MKPISYLPVDAPLACRYFPRTVPPPPEPLRRPIPREFLERVTRALLLRLLAPHAEALTSARHAFPLAALAASAQTDRTHVDTLWRLLSSPSPDLTQLHDDLTAISDLATHTAHEILLSHDSPDAPDARVLDRDLGSEDCAAVAFLDHRAIFDAARPQSPSPQTRVFGSFESKHPRPLPDDPASARRAKFLRLMSTQLDARSRSDHFRMHEWRSGTERHMEMVYGRLASTRDLLGKTNGATHMNGATSTSTPTTTHDVTAQVTDRSTERARAIFHDDSLRLDIAGPDWFKELVRRAFGEAYFDSAAHFEGDETLTLDPLAHLESALATRDVPGLKKVELQEVWIDLADGSGWMATGARNDCTKGASGGYALRGLSDGTPVEATFLLYTTAKTRPVKLTLVTPRKLDFDRRDPRVVRIVRDWVVAAGYMRMPSHLRAAEDEPANDEARADDAPAESTRAEDRSG